MANPSIVIAGGSGLIGSACQDLFIKEGYRVYILTRRKDTKPGEISWNPDEHWIAENVVDGASAVINLCGLSIADKRWTSRYKRLLEESRVVPTQFLNSLINKSAKPPDCYIGASGIGIYGDQGSRPILDDSEIVAPGFVAELVQSWELAHHAIHRSRNVVLRIGVVISRNGGFLGKLILPMRFGLFPYFGTGKQLLSWIHIDDLTQLILYCIRTPSISGTYHATSPEVIAQHDLMRTLKVVAHKPGILFGVPSFLLRLVFGQMSSLLFESADVRPDKIMRAGFRHSFPDMRSSLQAALKSETT